MNRNRGQHSRLTLLLLISLLLFKGVAAAAMLCCGPDHSAHATSHSQSSDHNVAVDHSHHNMPEHSDHQMTTHDSSWSAMNEHSSACSGCAVSCAAAVLMVNPSDFIPEPPQNERILSSTPLVYPLTGPGLERPPRLHS